jgi:hypothetical protein
MPEDWRIHVRLEAESRADELMARLNARNLVHDLRESFHERVIVSRDGAMVFCYANSRQQVEAAARAIESISSEHGWQLQTAVERWHPSAERWQPPDEQLAGTGAQNSREHQELIESERAESREQGFPMFEVRVTCESRQAAESLAQQLASERIPIVHRWQFVLVGAADEDSANSIAARVRAEAPPGTTVTVEGSIQEITQDAPYATPFSPFAVFGGLGG